VSPAEREAVNATPSFVPVVDSVPADFPSTVRCALPDAKPAAVKSLEAFTVLVAVS
jgi:hypothetical protein